MTGIIWHWAFAVADLSPAITVVVFVILGGSRTKTRRDWSGLRVHWCEVILKGTKDERLATAVAQEKKLNYTHRRSLDAAARLILWEYWWRTECSSYAWLSVQGRKHRSASIDLICSLFRFVILSYFVPPAFL